MARGLTQAGAARGLPTRINVDHGTESTSKVRNQWASWHRIKLDFSRPGKLVDNPFIEALNGTPRRECLSSHWFLGLKGLQQTLEAWRQDDNNKRPHSSLAGVPPALLHPLPHGLPALRQEALELVPLLGRQLYLCLLVRANPDDLAVPAKPLDEEPLSTGWTS